MLWIPRNKGGWTFRDILKSLEDPGWARKRVPGAYVAGDLVENKKCILLCGTCKHGFDWKKHHYYSYAKYDDIYAQGKCDKCKTEGTRMFIYMHESTLGQAGITRRDTHRQRREKASIVG